VEPAELWPECKSPANPGGGITQSRWAAKEPKTGYHHKKQHIDF